MRRMRLLMLPVLASILVSLFFYGCAKSPKKPSPGELREEPTISLYVKETGQRKQLKMEEYVAGVVAAEMETNWPVNALAAQAIIARTYTMKNIETGKIKKLHGTDASTDIEEFQAYSAAKINNNVRKAVEMTRGQVITYQGKYPNAWFSACCGGITASAQEGLAFTQEPTPYIKANVRDNCLSITVPENKHWQATIPKAKVMAAVQQVTGKNSGSLISAKITEKGGSGRAVKIALGDTEIGGPALRNAIGSDVVRSMLLNRLAVQGDNVVFTGKGFGHGVGMCQWGANLMAEKGENPEDIINFYYQGVKIEKKWK